MKKKVAIWVISLLIIGLNGFLIIKYSFNNNKHNENISSTTTTTEEVTTEVPTTTTSTSTTKKKKTTTTTTNKKKTTTTSKKTKTTTKSTSTTVKPTSTTTTTTSAKTTSTSSSSTTTTTTQFLTTAPTSSTTTTTTTTSTTSKTTTTTNKSSGLTTSDVYNSMIALKKDYPTGTPWDNSNYYEWKGGVFTGGYGCAAFAFMLSDAAFGNRKAKQVYNFDNIQVGDILRINDDTHFVIVLSIDGNTYTVAEGNYNKAVKWGRKISLSSIKANGTYILTRW